MFCFLLSQIAVSEFLDIYPKACSDAKRWALFSLHTNIHCDPSADLKYLAYLFYTIHSFPFIYLRRDIGLAHWPSNVTTILLVASTIRFKWVLYLCLPSLITHSFFLKWRIIVLQYCVSFCCTRKWIRYMYTYILSLLNFPPTPYLCPIHLGLYRAPSWAPCAVEQVPTSCLSYTW